MDYAHYDFSPSRGMRRPTPVTPASPMYGVRPPMHRSRQVIDQIHDDVNDENTDNHRHVGEDSGGVQSPPAGDDLSTDPAETDCDEE